MTIKQLAVEEGVSKQAIWKTIDKLGMRDDLQSDGHAIQLTDDQIDRIRTFRQRKGSSTASTSASTEGCQPPTEPSTSQQPVDGKPETVDGNQREVDVNQHEVDGNPASTASTDQSADDQAARLLALLEQDLNAMREQLAARDAEILALRQQLDAARLRIDQLTNAALNLAGKPLLEQENKSRFRRVLDALKGR